MALPASVAAVMTSGAAEAKAGPKLPIGERGAPPAGLADVPSPSRRRGGASKRAEMSPAQALLSSSPVKSGASSYREQLRASGLDALQRVRGGSTPGGVRSQLPSPVGSPTQRGGPLQLSFGAVPTQSGPGFDAAARTPPMVQLEQQIPFGPFCGAPQVAGFSPVASTGFITPGPSTGTASFFDIAQTPVAPFQMPEMPQPQSQPQVPEMMAPMPHFGSAPFDGEALAAQLRAAAPEVYED